MDRKLTISDRCVGCGLCVKVCIRGHLVVGEDRRAREVESPYSCFECGHCAAVCPEGAISLMSAAEEATPAESPPVSPVELSELYRQRRSARWFDRSCTGEELESLISSVRYSPTAENSQKVRFAVIDGKFPEFMDLLASILRTHTDEHPRLEQFVDYVDSGQEGRNNPFTWEGRQVLIAFARFPADALIAMEQLDLMAFSMGLGGFHSRWILQAAENDPAKFMSFFPGIDDGLLPYAAYVIGHPRMKYRRTVPRKDRDVLWI